MWFFWNMFFIFIKKIWVVALFCVVICYFFFINWASFFNKGIWVNLFKLIFSFPPLFHSQSNKKKEKIKSFLSSHHFLLFDLGEKTKETENREKNIFRPTFFILPIWEEKVLNDIIYTNTLTLSCIFFLLSSLGSDVAFFLGQQRCQ